MKRTISFALLMLLGDAAQAEMVNQWTFEDGTANDYVGGLSGTTYGGLKIEGGVAYFDGSDDYIQTESIQSALSERTIVIWLSMTNFSQVNGGVFTVDDPWEPETRENQFDALVYGERNAGAWYAGSDFGNRSYWDSEWERMDSSRSHDIMMVSISYALDDTVTMYLDGEVYGQFTSPNEIYQYEQGGANFLLGVRHSARLSEAGTNTVWNAFWEGAVYEARVYDTALTGSEMQSLYETSEFYNVPITDSAAVLMLALGLGAGRKRKGA